MSLRIRKNKIELPKEEYSLASKLDPQLITGLAIIILITGGFFSMLSSEIIFIMAGELLGMIVLVFSVYIQLNRTEWEDLLESAKAKELKKERDERNKQHKKEEKIKEKRIELMEKELLKRQRRIK